MSPGTKSQGRPWRRSIFFVLLGALVAFYVTVCVQIVRQSHRDEAQTADAIVVFGAAQYAGKPSPVLKSRLDHALELYERKLATLVITTGGAGRDPIYSEGGVGRDYLAAHGVGDRHLIAETQGDNTAESAERVAVILRANGLKDCVAVSDAYHMFRIKKLMEAQGVRTYASPRQQPGMQFATRWGTVMREALSYTLWRMHVT
jgi:uncharacterized SAM-binding protein YcdF (DUF218 family)